MSHYDDSYEHEQELARERREVYLNEAILDGLNKLTLSEKEIVSMVIENIEDFKGFIAILKTIKKFDI